MLTTTLSIEIFTLETEEGDQGVGDPDFLAELHLRDGGHLDDITAEGEAGTLYGDGRAVVPGGGEPGQPVPRV